MHGKKRAEYKARFQDSKTAAALAHKAHQWHALQKTLLEHRRLGLQQQQQQEEEEEEEEETISNLQTTLQLLEKALLVNPDPLHLWNHRRDVLLRLVGRDKPNHHHQQHQPSNEMTSLSVSSKGWIPPTEWTFTQAALQRNPKSYGAWFHRKWLLQQEYTHGGTTLQESFLQTELALCSQLLQMDERNFHGWNYRRCSNNVF